jgi:hypothetical protein
MTNETRNHLREEDIVPYLESQLAKPERARVDAHLADCAACRTQLAELRSVMGVLDEWVAVEPSPSFDAAVRQRIAAVSEKMVVWEWLSLRPALGAAVVMAVLLTGAIGLWRVSPPETTGGSPEVVLEQSLSEEWIEILAEEDTLTLVENQELLADYELLQQFDVLFELAEGEERQL